MNASLTDRYIAAALRGVPEKQQVEIGAELRELVGDAIDADAKTAERDALTELGDPARLAAAYLDRPLYLIGPSYYLEWQRLLKLLLSIVVPIIVIVMLMVNINDGASAVAAIFGALGTGFMIAVQIAFWVSVGFAVAERAGSRGIVDEWTPDELPVMETGTPGTDRTELIAGLVFLAAFAGVVIWQMRWPFTTTVDGEPIVLLSDAVLTTWLPYILALIAVEAVLAIAIFWRGGWNTAFAAVNTLLQAAWAVPLTWLLVTDRAVNPDYVASVDALVGDVVWPSIRWSAVVVIAICAWDAIDGFRKARRAAKWRIAHGAATSGAAS